MAGAHPNSCGADPKCWLAHNMSAGLMQEVARTVQGRRSRDMPYRAEFELWRVAPNCGVWRHTEAIGLDHTSDAIHECPSVQIPHSVTQLALVEPWSAPQ